METKKPFDPIVFKKHQRYFYVFLCLSILSVIDIGTRQAVSSQYGLSEIGYVAFFIGKIIGIVSVPLSGAVTVLFSLIFSFAIVWIPITIIEYFKLKKLKQIEGSNLN